MLGFVTQVITSVHLQTSTFCAHISHNFLEEMADCFKTKIIDITDFWSNTGILFSLGLPRWCSGKEYACQCTRWRRRGFDPWVRKIPWRRAWQPTSGYLPGECHGQRNQVGYSPWGHKESDTTEVTKHIRLQPQHTIPVPDRLQILHRS